MNLRFLGGVAEVGRNAMLLETEASRFLLDYGIMPHDPPQYPQPAPPLDAALLTHAHLDHSGFMPVVAADHAAPILASPLTQPLAELLCRDSLKVCRLEGYPQPYAPEAITDMMGAFQDVTAGTERPLGDVTLRAHDAGHIPGSLMFEVDDGSQTLLFTGDINLIDTRLVRAAKPVRCDTLVVESTYSGRNHPDRRETEKRFLDSVDEVVQRGGTVVCPAFAVGRTQEILMVLAGHGYDVWVDGMGKQVAKHMLETPSSLRSPREMSRAFEEAKLVKTPHQRDHAADRADVIVTTSGMMDGGPVVHYLRKLYKDADSAVFFTGFQVPGSKGRLLRDEGFFTFEHGPPERVACQLKAFDFSGHAGHDELVQFARECRPERVVLFHSDNREPLADALREFTEPVLLETGQDASLA